MSPAQTSASSLLDFLGYVSPGLIEQLLKYIIPVPLCVFLHQLPEWSKVWQCCVIVGDLVHKRPIRPHVFWNCFSVPICRFRATLKFSHSAKNASQSVSSIFPSSSRNCGDLTHVTFCACTAPLWWPSIARLSATVVFLSVARSCSVLN